MQSRSNHLLSACLVVLLFLTSCSKDLVPVLSVYVVTYTLETQGNVTITNAEYLAPDGSWTDVPAKLTNLADVFPSSSGNNAGFRATGTVHGSVMIRMTARGSSTNNIMVDLSDTCVGTTGTTPCNLGREQQLQ